jgi:hypothetical protein
MIFLEKLLLTKSAKKLIPCFWETQGFITELIRAQSWTPYSVSSVHSSLSDPNASKSHYDHLPMYTEDFLWEDPAKIV